MKIRITEIARFEFNDAKQFYEIEQTGLGQYFTGNKKISENNRKVLLCRNFRNEKYKTLSSTKISL
ncbi:hypothetical protein ACFL2K_04270 [Candidatus Margulisiibacteriota bacterium]